jgi:hypothetical protein
MKFKGDIIITDPCYIIKKQNKDFSSYPRYQDYITCDDDGDPVHYRTNHELYLQEHAAYDKALDEWRRANESDWDKCNCGSNMEELGIKNYLTESTIYGDWSCHVFNSDTKELIGRFCADSGLVSVFLLNEVLAYNPGFDYHINPAFSHTTTLIKDFDGEVMIEFNRERDEVEVVGRGNVNFVTHQTGF